MICVKQVASKNGDVHLADFIESEFLTEQVKLLWCFYVSGKYML